METLKRAAKISSLRGRISSVKTDAPADNSGIVQPTAKKKIQPVVAPPMDVAAEVDKALQPAKDAQAEAHAEALRKAREEGKTEGIKIGGDTAKRVAQDLETQKNQSKAPPQFFSAHDRAKYDRTQQLAAQGLNPSQIAQKMDKMGFGGATNVPGSLEGLPKNFLDANNLTVTPPSGGKTAQGLTPDDQWAKLFQPQNPAPAQQGQPAAPMRPGDQAFHDVLGPAWAPQDGEAPADARLRRANMIRDAVTSGTQYGTVGVGQGEILPNVPGVQNPAGARGFVSPYGSGFATGMPLPSATPVSPVANANLLLPSANRPPAGYPAPDMTNIPLS